jgi:drug/metabolite transporter (DMT)-like permease
MTAATPPTRIYIKLVLGALFWGGAYIAGRIATGEMSAIAAALWRYAVATVALLCISFAADSGLPRLNGRQWVGVALLGATGVAIFNLCFMFGLERVTAARASLIMALSPAVTLLGAAWFLREPLTRRNGIGIVVALLGVLVVLSRGHPLTLLNGDIGIGDVVLLGCPVSWALYTLLGKTLLKGLSPIAATTYAALTGTAMLAAIAAFTGDLVVPAVSWRAWAAIGFVGFFSTTVAFVWFYEGVRSIGPSRTSVFINLVPIFAITLGVLMLGERVDSSIVVGGALIVVGVWLLNRPRAPLPAPALAR